MSNSAKDEEISTTSKKKKSYKRNRNSNSYLTQIWEPKQKIPRLQTLEEDLVCKFSNLSDIDPEISNYPLNNSKDQEYCNYSQVNFCDDYKIEQLLKQKLAMEASLQEFEEDKIIKTTLDISENCGILSTQILRDMGNQPGCSKDGTIFDFKQNFEYSNYKPIADNYFESDEETSSISISSSESPRIFEKREKKYLNPQEAKQRTNKWYQKFAQYQQRVKEGKETKMKENEVEVGDCKRFRVMRRRSDSSEQTFGRKLRSERLPDKRYKIKYTDGYYRSHSRTTVMRDRSRRMNKTKKRGNSRSGVYSTSDTDISDDGKSYLDMIVKRMRKKSEECIKRSINAREVVVASSNKWNSSSDHSSESDVLYLSELPIASTGTCSSIAESKNLGQFTKLPPFISPMHTTESSDNSKSPYSLNDEGVYLDDADINMESDLSNTRIFKSALDGCMMIDE